MIERESERVRVRKDLVINESSFVRYWAMHFDANPLIVQELGKKLLVDTRVLRHTFIKLGDKLENVVERPDKT